jgi:hypothetical protein
MEIEITQMLDGYTDQIPLGTLNSRTVKDEHGDTGETLTIDAAGAGSLGGGKALQTINDKDLVLNKTKIGGQMDVGRIGSLLTTQAFIDRCVSGDIVAGQEIWSYMDCPASMTQVASYQNHLVASGRGSLSAATITSRATDKRAKRMEKMFKDDCADILQCINRDRMPIDTVLEIYSQDLIDAAVNETTWADYNEALAIAAK